MTPLGALSLTAAAQRALETELLRPLYRDPFGRQLAGEAGWASMRAMREMRWAFPSSGPDPYLTIRTRYFDDALGHVLNDPAIRQVVILGAGMDTRAFRLDWPSDVVVFEVDRDEVFDRKEPLLKSLNARPSSSRRIVRADLGRAWVSALVKAGFEPQRKAAFLLEGVLLFLEDALVRCLFRDLKRIARPGSWIGLDLVSADTLTSYFMVPFLAKLAELGQPPWRFAVNEPEMFLAECGWDATAVVAGAPEANYGRWTYGYIPRGTPGVPRMSLTQGRMTGHDPA